MVRQVIEKLGDWKQLASVAGIIVLIVTAAGVFQSMRAELSSAQAQIADLRISVARIDNVRDRLARVETKLEGHVVGGPHRQALERLRMVETALAKVSTKQEEIATDVHQILKEMTRGN